MTQTVQSATTPTLTDTETPAPHHIPGAWYDLSFRVRAAQTVASCALEALPCGLKGLEYERMNNVGNLIAAVQDILMLMEQDVNLMEQQLKAGAPGGVQ